MRDYFVRVLVKVDSLVTVKNGVIQVLELVKSQSGLVKIGYVSGIISSDGPAHMEKNIQILTEHTTKLREKHNFPLFSTTDIFTQEIYAKLQESALPLLERELLFRQFWREILSLGYITDIFMTPRWQQSEGAKDEHQVAKELNLTIHYLD